MGNRTLLWRSAGYCLSAALLITVATSANTFAAPPEVPPGLAKKDPPGVPPGQAKKGILQIESMGGRTFGGTEVFNPDDPTGSRYLSCDHGVTEWAIPVGPGKHPMVLTHGSGIRGYQTTFDGQPGFQTIHLRDKYPVYLVDFPRTGRAARACDTVGPFVPNLNSNTIVRNRIAEWPLGQPTPTYLPGIAFSQDPEALNQFLRIQYPEFNASLNIEIESDALVVLLEELFEEHGKAAIVHYHSSGFARALLVPRKTDKIAGTIGWEPSTNRTVFPEGELPPPILLADGSTTPAGTEVPLEEFLKLTQAPWVFIWGDNIPTEPTLGHIGESRRVLVERFKLFAEAINNHGGNAVNIILPEVGVFGNTHYPYADTNINEVADVVSEWLEEQGLDN